MTEALIGGSSFRKNSSPIAAYFAVGFLFFLILLGGGTSGWSQGIAMGVIGGLLIYAPPKRTPGRLVDTAAAGLVILSLLGLVPIGGFNRPDWWRSATGDFRIELSATVSSQPLLTVEAILLLIAALSWFYLVCTVEVDRSSRTGILWAFAAGVTILAVAIILGTINEWKYPFGKEAQSFSFFPNRNQTSSILILGGVISFSLSLHAIRRRSLTAIVGIGAVLLILFALIFSLSRAGVLLFFAGCLISMLGYLPTSRSRLGRNVGVALSVLILAASALLYFGGDTMRRISGLLNLNDGGPADFRLRIYEDTLNLMADHPFFGLGLGNFPQIFPQYREASRSASAIIHPESDWLWLGAELGIPGLLFAVLGLVGLWRALGRDQPRRVSLSRSGILSALLVFLIHTLVDVPGHRLGTILSAFLLFSMALNRSDSVLPKTPLPQAFWRGLGLLLVGAGGIWVSAFSMALPLHSKVVEQIAEKALKKGDSEELDFTGRACERAVYWTPMKWQAYFNRAQFHLFREKDPHGAFDDFRRSRFLEPVNAEVAYLEGKAWAPFSPTYALSAWHEALRRESIDRLTLFREIVSHTIHLPSYRAGLRRLSTLDPELGYQYLSNFKGTAFLDEMDAVLAADPAFEQIPPSKREQLFERWVRNGGASKLRHHFSQFPFLGETYWRSFAESLAALGQFREACQIILESSATPAPPGAESPFDLERLQASFRKNPRNVRLGVSLLKAEIETENWDRAYRTTRLLTENTDLPPFVSYWHARLLHGKGEYKKSWEAWRRWLERTN